MRLLLYFLVFLGQAMLSNCFAQHSNAAFIRISTNQGLSQGHVSSILKDDKGFMWFATDGGLNKYDGYTFTKFKNKVGDPNSISNDFVHDVIQDKDGFLWIATGSGLDKLDIKTNTFSLYRPGKDVDVFDVLNDSKDRVWLGTKDGLFLFNKQTKKFKQFINNPADMQSLSNNLVYQLAEDNKGNIWIATKDGLDCFNTTTEKFTVYKNGPTEKNGLQTNWFRAVYKDHLGNIWAGSNDDGIVKFNEATNHFTAYKHDPLNNYSLAYDDILCFEEDRFNNLWIGTENGGISIYNSATNNFKNIKNDLTDPQSISSNSIYCLYKDNSGSIWAGTWANGVNLLPVLGKKFTTYTQVPGNVNSLSHPTVLSITGDAKNDIWLATDGGGLNHFNFKTKAFTHYTNDEKNTGPVKTNFIISVINAAPGLLALGYQHDGLDIFDTYTGTVKKHVAFIDKNADLSVNCQLKDNKGNIWAGTWGGGLYKLDQNFDITLVYNSKDSTHFMSSDFINCLMQDKEGTIWIGTDNGLNKLNAATGKCTHYNHTDAKTSISHNEINQVFEDATGKIWIASAGGLDLFDKAQEKLVSFTSTDGLPSSSIQSIQQDKNGTLWLSTTNGIASFDTATKKSRNYTMDDGLQGKEFKAGCSYVNSDGNIFFGGTNGFNYVDPENLQDNAFIPPVYITGVLIFNKPLQADGRDVVLQTNITDAKQLKISYKQSVITFEFAALNFTYSEKNQYAYMLEGFDKEWIYAGTQRSATYTNLDAGTYYFKVKATNNDGIWNEKGTTLKIIISPPFWKTWWFILLAFIAGIALVLTFLKVRIRAVEKQRLLLEQQVEKQTGELVKLNLQESNARIEAEKLKAIAESANEKLIAKNNEMEEFAYVASHDLKEPLRTTTSFIKLLQKKYAGQLDEQADKYIRFINESSERMKVLIEDLLEFSRIGNNPKLTTIDCNQLLTTVLADIDVTIQESGAAVTSTSLPVITGYNTEMKLLFQNLLINAVKFKKPGVAPEISVTSQDSGTHWQFAFKDNGIGIDPAFKDKIFKIFQRLHSISDYQGSGIGLAHCNKIAALHNGKIWVDSALGEGCTFFFTVQKNLN